MSSMTPDPKKADARVNAARTRAVDAQQRHQQPDPTARPDGPSPDVANAVNPKATER